ncbi:MAG TPA: methyltransferase domain-containing protein [Thermoanaerobaculia bacterium]|nr:methyltransferase domain-containing protein [Thermoanaerobaculia bacterium]
MDRIRSWFHHLQSREAYSAAYERYYRRVKCRPGLKYLEREFRILIGRKTRRMVERCARSTEFKLLERETLRLPARRVLDAGCGEGRVALALGAEHPDLSVEGIEVSATNVRIAQRLNRFSNVAFHHGSIEEADRLFRIESLDLVYSFGVLKHVWDVDEAVGAALKLLRPGGRYCAVVPMNEFRAKGPLPEFKPEDTACHVRVFSERFGHFPDFSLVMLPGEWRPGRYPEAIEPVEFGAFFVVFSKA